MPDTPYDDGAFLWLPSEITTDYPVKYRGGFVLESRRRVDAKLSERRRLRRYQAQERRDARRPQRDPFADPAFRRCSSEVASVRSALAAGVNRREAASVAYSAFSKLSEATQNDSIDPVDVTDALERLGDILGSEPDFQFSLPSIQILTSTQWSRIGDDLEADMLLSFAFAELDRASIVPDDLTRAAANRYIALAHCARSKLYSKAGRAEAALEALKQGWQTAEATDSPQHRFFVAERYLHLLQQQGHAADVVEGASVFVESLRVQSGPLSDPLLVNWPKGGNDDSH